MSENPLSAWFRRATITVALPSQGRWWPEGTLDMPVTGEIGIFPSTAKDEVILKTPDSLLNGSSVTDLIASCCPAIHNPWATPTVDLDTVLIAIRIASYGDTMPIAVTCPVEKCAHETEFDLNLQQILQSVPPVTGYGEPETIGELTFVFKPQTFESLNRTNRRNFEQRKLIQQLAITDNDVSQDPEFGSTLKSLAKENLLVLSDGIESITTPDEVVITDHDHIRDFVDNIEYAVYKKIQESVSALANAHRIPPISVTCEKCEHSYTAPVEFDYSHFFG